MIQDGYLMILHNTFQLDVQQIFGIDQIYTLGEQNSD